MALLVIMLARVAIANIVIAVIFGGFTMRAVDVFRVTLVNGPRHSWHL